jgi:multiple sugar transport system permease protein
MAEQSVQTLPGTTHKQKRDRLRRSIVGVAFLVVLIVTLPPILWILATSLKGQTEAIQYPPKWIPKFLHLENFSAILASGASQFFINSALIAAGSIGLVLVIAVPAAYASVRFSFRGRETLMTLLLVVSMVPAIAVLVALYAMFINSSLINTYPLLIVVYTAMLSGQAVWFVRSFIENVPREIEEAAQIDGCSRFRLIYHVVLPLIRPGLAAVAIFVFIFIWNDYLVGTVLTTSESMRTVQVGLVRYISTEEGRFWHLFGAYVVLAFAPVLAIFAAFQNWFVSGLMAGGVKG